MATNSNKKVLTKEDIHKLVNQEKRAIVTFEGDVYDASEFKRTHPGGPKLIDDLVGKDITEEFYDAEHTKIALRALNEMKIGTINENVTETETREDDLNKERMKEIEGEEWRDLVDPLKGTVYQVFSKMNLENYTKFVNDPKHLTEPGKTYMRMFDHPILEFFSFTPWYAVGLFWIPLALYKLWEASFLLSPTIITITFLFGVLLWTFLEYTFHRFIFHMEQFMPDNSILITTHYMLHGVHHAFPMDAGRLVFPPVVGILFYFAILAGLQVFFSESLSIGIMAGVISGYLSYDMGHYYLHHSQPLKIVEYRKKYHMYHHYKDPDNGYGISTSFWDKVFGTELDMSKKISK